MKRKIAILFILVLLFIYKHSFAQDYQSKDPIPAIEEPEMDPEDLVPEPIPNTVINIPSESLEQENQNNQKGTIPASEPNQINSPVITGNPQTQVIQENNQQNNLISLDVRGMDITDVLKMITSRTGMNIIIGKNVTGRVTMFLKNVDIWDAFEIIILSNDLAYDKDKAGDIINVMTQRDYELLYGERYKDKKISKIMTPIYSKAGELSKSLMQIKSNIGKIVVDEGSNTIILVDIPEKIKEMESFVLKTDVPTETRVFNLNYAVADKLSPKLQELLTKGVGSIKLDERTNKIAITDYPAKLDQMANIIKAFDEKTSQVIIDAQIIEINPQKDQFSMGVDWDYWLKNHVRFVSSMPAPTVTDITTIPNRVSFGVAAAGSSVNSVGQYKSIVDILKVIGETKILSSPRIMALNNQEAKILVGKKDAYITSSTTQSGESAVTSQAVNFVETGIKLFVTPTINHDGFVTMKIKPEISSSKITDVTAEGKITQIPIVTTSESETTIMVKDGTTIIIAGLKRDSKSKEIKKIPFIGDIPFLGVFARNTKEENIRTELVIFITPRIISGAEPLDYTRLTKDKDIADIQSQAIEQKEANKK